MCEVGAVIALIASLATTVYQTQQANRAADDQADAIAAQAATNIAALEDKSEEVSDAADLERFEKKKMLQREVAATRAAQSEGGVLFGNTAIRSMSSALIGGGQDVAIIDKHAVNLQKQIARQKESVATGAALQLSGLSWTSPLMSGLRGVSSGLSAYTSAGGRFGQ